MTRAIREYAQETGMPSVQTGGGIRTRSSRSMARLDEESVGNSWLNAELFRLR